MLWIADSMTSSLHSFPSLAHSNNVSIRIFPIYFKLCKLEKHKYYENILKLSRLFLWSLKTHMKIEYRIKNNIVYNFLGEDQCKQRLIENTTFIILYFSDLIPILSSKTFTVSTNDLNLLGKRWVNVQVSIINRWSFILHRLEKVM